MKTAKTIVKPAFSRHPPPVTRHPENVQKKIKKNVDALLAFWQIGFTHGNNRTTTQNKMRTKTLLLSAAALLAAGIVTSQAQVYSQNVVGYANVVTPGNGATYYMISVPFAMGVSNGANEVFGTTLPNNTFILTWDSAHQTFKTVQYDGSAPAGTGLYWYDAGESTTVNPPILPVGQGFFILPSGPVTNLFIGTVAVNVGTSNVMTLAGNGATYFMVASAVPYAGVITNGNDSTGGPNLNGLPNNTFVLTWDSVHQKFQTVQYDGSAPAGPGLFWYDAGESATVAPPSLSVGQGFFILPSGSYNWKTGL